MIFPSKEYVVFLFVSITFGQASVLTIGQHREYSSMGTPPRRFKMNPGTSFSAFVHLRIVDDHCMSEGYSYA